MNSPKSQELHDTVAVNSEQPVSEPETFISEYTSASSLLESHPITVPLKNFMRLEGEMWTFQRPPLHGLDPSTCVADGLLGKLYA